MSKARHLWDLLIKPQQIKKIINNFGEKKQSIKD